MTVAFQVLELLERFRFMTRVQLRDAGLTVSTDHLGEVLRQLGKLRQIGHTSPGVLPGAGRLPFVYYLLKKGALALAEANRLDLETLNWCESKPGLTHDLQHRLACVSVHLWLARSLGEHLAVFRPYYTMTSSDGGVRHSSRLLVGGKAFVPDALFAIEQSGQRFGYVLEVQRSKRRAALIDQLGNHANAIREGVAAISLGVDEVAVMYVVEHERDLIGLKSAAKTLAPLRGLLFGRTLDSLMDEQGFQMKGWEKLA